MGADFYFDLITALWLGFTGACIGSFLNVVAYRLPLRMSVVWKASHCPKCRHAIRARDNVPVVGWLALGGKCRDCRAAISPRYAIVEAILGAVFFVLAYVELFSGGANLPGGPFTEFTGAVDLVWYPDWSIIGLYLYHCLLMSMLTVLALFDLDKNPIPHRFAWFTLAVIVVGSLATPLLYPDRHWFAGDERIAGLVDAAAGAVFLSCYGFVIWAFVKAVAGRRDAPMASNAVRYSFALAFAGYLAGGMLGRNAAMALLLPWAGGMVLARLANTMSSARRLSLVPALWLATFVFLLFWKPLVGMLRFG